VSDIAQGAETHTDRLKRLRADSTAAAPRAKPSRKEPEVGAAQRGARREREEEKPARGAAKPPAEGVRQQVPAAGGNRKERRRRLQKPREGEE